MAYEEKKYSEDENDGLELILRFARILLAKWWMIAILAVIVALAGFTVAKVTYEEAFVSAIIFNVSNKDRDVAGAAATYVTSSDADASKTIAANFQYLIQKSNDFISLVQQNVEAQTGQKFSAKEIRSFVSVEAIADTTLLNVIVRSDDKEVTNAVARAIQSVYSTYVKDAFETADIKVADSATPAQLAPDTSVLVYSAIGLMAGAMIAAAFILIRSRIENKVFSSDDIKKNFNLNIIASIAKIKKKNGKNERSRLLITDKNVGLPFIETFKLIRTKLENVKLKKGYSVFTITSSTESEGKTTCSVNTAISLAKSGKSVLLIDADLRKPAVAKMLGLSLDADEKGVHDIVVGGKTFEEAVKYVEKYNLYLLVSSSPVEDPSEILASNAMANIINEAKKNFDYVIVDCPPAGLVADAAIVANYSDSIIFVATENKVSMAQIEYALSDLYTTKAEVLGCIYNNTESKSVFGATQKNGYYEGFGTSYYYGTYGASGSSRSKK